jgi:hypothetical protein
VTGGALLCLPTTAPAYKPTTICLLNLGAATATTSECAFPPVFRFNGGFSPARLPRKERTPGSLSMSGEFEYPGSESPLQEEIVVSFDRDGAIDAAGLPVCGGKLVEALDVSDARRRCHDSVIGTGKAHMNVPSLAQEPIPFRLTLFNGGVRRGKARILIKASTDQPAVKSLVVRSDIEKARKGRYGLQMVVKVPKIAGEAGQLLDFEVTTGRRAEIKGEGRSYALARCSSGALYGRMESVFADSTRGIGTIVRPCSPRRAEPAAPSAG